MSKPFNPKDRYYHLAKEEGFRARSAYKLQEIQLRTKILKKGMHVLDLGAAPGSWAQVTAPLIRPGFVIAIDLEPMEDIPHVTSIRGDIFSEDVANKIAAIYPQKFDVILSDLAPKTSGIKDVDQFKSVELNAQVLTYAERYLKKGGTVVMKLFMGGDFPEFQKKLKLQFKEVRHIKPKATRDRSVEVYLICTGFGVTKIRPMEVVS